MTGIKTPHQKGNDLQKVAYQIEQLILKSNPDLSNKNFKIEQKKIVFAGGVKHEIDLYVAVDLGNGYSSLFIFELKNSKKAVGKTEIIDFSEKIAVTSATKGYFIAKRLSKYAIAQVKKDPRIEYLQVEELGPGVVGMPISLHFLLKDDSSVEASIIAKGADRYFEFNPKEHNVCLNGKKVNLENCLTEWTTKAVNEYESTLQSNKMPSGPLKRVFTKVCTFEDGQLFIDNLEIEVIELKITANWRIVWPTIRSTFDVKTRGRVLILEEIYYGDGHVQMDLIELEKSA